MFTNFFKVILICITASSSIAKATLITDLIERDWTAIGDGAITYDKSTGLEWLDLNQTRGNSILDTEAENFFGEFRWATNTEIEELFDAVFVGIDYRVTSSSDAVSAGQVFQSLFGITSGSQYSIGISRGSPTVSNPTRFGLGYVRVLPTQVILRDPLDHCCFNINSSSSGVGSWLVRSAAIPSSLSIDIPEPSILAIFGLGLMGLVSRRFKKQ